MKRKLESRVAIITGTARGLGIALAEQFASDGATLLLVDVNAEGLDDVAGKARALGAADVVWTTQDLSREEGGAAIAKMALDRWGRIDILVNNAGGGIIRPFLEHTAETLRTTVDRNLWTTIWCSRAVLPSMIERNYGRIVNIASIAGKEGNPNACAYSASKAGVISLTKSLGKELATTGVRVNAIAPAVIETEMLEQSTREHIAYMVSKIPMGRLGQVDEVAALVCWLASAECSFSTGAVFDISGGRATY